MEEGKKIEKVNMIQSIATIHEPLEFLKNPEMGLSEVGDECIVKTNAAIFAHSSHNTRKSKLVILISKQTTALFLFLTAAPLEGIVNSVVSIRLLVQL